MKPVVCVIAHPDDEAFGPAGTLAHFAKDRDVAIICATRGDSDPQFTKHNPQSLAVRREKELRTSAAILGVKKVLFLNFKDGSLNNNSYHKLATAIGRALNTLKAETVITFELNGISGHLDHVAVALATTYAFYRTPTAHKLLYLRALEAVMKQDRDTYFVYTPPGFEKKDIDLVVDTAPYWDLRVKAMFAHESQREDAERILKRASKFPKEEYFRVLTK